MGDIAVNIKKDKFTKRVNDMLAEQCKGEISINKNSMQDYIVSFNYERESDIDIIAGMICGIIIGEYEQDAIYKLINNSYGFYDSADRQNIFARTIKSIGEDEDKTRIIKAALSDYLRNTDYIDIDGFISFRLNEYIKLLRMFVNRAVDSFLIEKDYLEFVRLLKYFVDLQEPKSELLHIIYTQSGYRLKTLKGEDITDECVEEYLKSENNDEVNFDDLLLNTLISIVPRKIYIHNLEFMKNNELLKTIKNVFGKRVVVCNGCEKCVNILRL